MNSHQKVPASQPRPKSQPSQNPRQPAARGLIHYASEDVRWEAGQQVAVFRGGHNAVTGQQSVITINSIIGTRGVPGINPFDLRPSLTNSKLFARDRNVCAYCGNHFHESDLTREHIIPQALGAPRPLMGAA